MVFPPLISEFELRRFFLLEFLFFRVEFSFCCQISGTLVVGAFVGGNDF